MADFVRMSCNTAARTHDEDELCDAAPRGSSPWMSVGQAIERSGLYDSPRIAQFLERNDRLDVAAS